MKDIQIEIEEVMAKNNLFKRLYECVDELGELDHDLDEGATRALLAHLLLKNKLHITAAIGIIRKHFDHISDAVKLVEKCLDYGYIEFNNITECIEAVFKLDSEVRHELSLFQYPLPMLTKPKTINLNKQGGYLTFDTGILLNAKSDKDLCLDHINRVNSIPLCFNHKVRLKLKIVWKTLLRPNPKETPTERRLKVQALERFNNESQYVIDMLSEYSDTFHSTHAYDTRGRYYVYGYHVNYQGTDWHKAITEFDKKILIEE